jgi:hypothetical protein
MAIAKKTTKSLATPKPQEATALLRADHKHVSDLFEQYEKTRSVPKKMSLVSQICTELGVHTKIEEEIFYPAVKAALKDKEMVPEATVEHASVKDLIALKLKSIASRGRNHFSLKRPAPSHVARRSPLQAAERDDRDKRGSEGRNEQPACIDRALAKAATKN